MDVETAERSAAEGVSGDPEAIAPGGAELGLVEREVAELASGEPQLVEATTVSYGSPLDENEFEAIARSILGRPDVGYQLAGSTLQQRVWSELRLIALTKNNGGQTHAAATGQRTWQSLQQDWGEADPSVAEIA